MATTGKSQVSKPPVLKLKKSPRLAVSEKPQIQIKPKLTLKRKVEESNVKVIQPEKPKTMELGIKPVDMPEERLTQKTTAEVEAKQKEEIPKEKEPSEFQSIIDQIFPVKLYDVRIIPVTRIKKEKIIQNFQKPEFDEYSKFTKFLEESIGKELPGIPLSLPEFKKKKEEVTQTKQKERKVKSHEFNVESKYPAKEEHKKIELWETQRETYERSVNILTNVWKSYLDVSRMGSGKTVITTKVARKLGLKLFVVAIPAIVPGWARMNDKYGIEIVDIIKYDTLKGMGSQLSHNWLERYEVAPGPSTTGRGKAKKNVVKYRVTEQFKEVARQGILLVFDEVQNIKNETNRFEACFTLIKEVILNHPNSRVALLSALPMDKMQAGVQLVRLLGIVTADNLYEYNFKTKKYTFPGLDQLFEWCRRFDPIKTREYESVIKTRDTIPLIIKELLVNVVKKQLITAAKPLKLPFDMDAYSYFVYMDKDSLSHIRLAESAMKSAKVSEDPKTGEKTLIKITDFTRGLILSARSKIASIARIAKEKLKEPHRKVIIYARQRYDVTWLKEELSEFGVVLLTGEITNEAKREASRKLFQESSDDYRVLIANPTVGGAGVDLDDQEGNYPRTTLVIPDMRFSDLVQLSGRTLRGTTKSKPELYFIYSNEFREELKILDNINRKTQISQEILPDEVQRLFPGDYPDKTESPKPTEKELSDHHPIDFTITAKDMTSEAAGVTTEATEIKTKEVDIFDFITYKQDYNLFKKHYSDVELYIRSALWIDQIGRMDDKKVKELRAEAKKKEDPKEFLGGLTDDFDIKYITEKWYQHFAPDKLEDPEFVNDLLEKYENCEDRLFNYLYRKYVDGKWKLKSKLWFGDCQKE